MSSQRWPARALSQCRWAPFGDSLVLPVPASNHPGAPVNDSTEANDLPAILAALTSTKARQQETSSRAGCRKTLLPPRLGRSPMIHHGSSARQAVVLLCRMRAEDGIAEAKALPGRAGEGRRKKKCPEQYRP